MKTLKRLVRYLNHSPRLIWKYNWSTETSDASVFVDTDFAGCYKTRRSTSGGMIMLGEHALRHWSVTQPTVALSSGEAELAGIVSGAAQGLGLKSMAHDLGFDINPHLFTDATAAIGICRKRGLSRIRHLSTSDLWVQERLRHGDFQPSKIPGAQNLADALTKHIDGSTLARHTQTMSISYEEGRAASAPSLTH